MLTVIPYAIVVCISGLEKKPAAYKYDGMLARASTGVKV